MSAHVNGANRAGLFVLGLLLVVGGAVGLLLGFGVRSVGSYQLSTPRPKQSVVPEPLTSFVAGHNWFWWALAALALLVALIGLRWLAAQLRTDRVYRFDATQDEQEGTTVIHAGALTDAVAAEAESISGVENASAQLISHPTRRLALAVTLNPYADIAEVRRELENGTVTHVRHVVDEPQLPVQIRLRPAATSRRALS